MFQDEQYVTWANEETVHLLSYSLDKDATEPEPMIEVERNGAKETVLAMYPMFTPNQAEYLVNDIDRNVKFPTKVPWAGVLAPDGKTVLAERKTGTAKEFRETFDAERKKLAPSISRVAWKTATGRIDAATEAEFDGAWGKAVAETLAARGVAKELPKPLAERIATLVEALAGARDEQLAAARKLSDPAARARELARIEADFRGLPAPPAEGAPAK